jgi:hypothetical protein
MFVFNSPDSTIDSIDILQENYLSVQSAGRFSGYNVQYLRRLLRSGKLDGKKIGQVWLIKLASLEGHIEISNSRDDRRWGSRKAKKTDEI